MEWTLSERVELSFSAIDICCQRTGEDILICISGGDRPHIGSAVLSVPRLSLKGDGSMSSTSSILNVPGHKDEYICRMVSEAVASALDVTVLCTGGFHVDELEKEEIEEVEKGVKASIPVLISRLEKLV